MYCAGTDMVFGAHQLLIIIYNLTVFVKLYQTLQRFGSGRKSVTDERTD